MTGLFVNVTDSLPLGLWKTTGPPVIAGGAYVTASPPDNAAVRQLRLWGYLDRRRLLKPIGAVPGDRVEVSPNGIRINGRALVHSAQLLHDGPGHPLPRVPAGCYAVAPGTVWLLSQDNPHSLDSRYFGPVPVRHLQNAAMPVWVRSAPVEAARTASARGDKVFASPPVTLLRRPQADTELTSAAPVADRCP
jgi:conjugative transfer signal peptidase TraF